MSAPQPPISPIAPIAPITPTTMTTTSTPGIAGRLAGYFQNARITPLLALVALLLGLFAVWVTPREEEPQINVTMANVLVGFPGASVAQVERMVAQPAEQVFSRMANVEHVYSVSRPGLAIITVQFAVGVPRSEALVRLYDTVHSQRDWLPPDLGTLEPLVKPKGIDDVPILSLTLWRKQPDASPLALQQVAHSIEAELKRVPGTREIQTIGGPGRAINVELDPTRLAAHGLSVSMLQAALRAANLALPAGEVVSGNQSVAVEAGSFLPDARAVAELVVGVQNGQPVFLQDVARVVDGPLPATRQVWHGDASGEYPAVTLAIGKQAGQNASQVTEAVLAQVALLKNRAIPADVQVTISRNYGETASQKARTLMQKLGFATLSVVALVWLALGRRAALIVGVAVLLTLTVILFASWAWGFTLNRVSLFALIFSIGILVDDAIVVVENIHRQQQLYPQQSLMQLIPAAVDEVGGPTILATLTVIAALLPMAFVSGLMGPYMSPIPINASMGMLLSLVIAFVVTPWLALRFLQPHPAARHAGNPAAANAPAAGATAGRLARGFNTLFTRLFTPLLDPRHGKRNRRRLLLAVLLLIGASLALPLLGWVQLKMLPFDNKSEFQVVLDMPPGTPLEHTASVLHELGRELAKEPQVAHYQAYAGSAGPVNFNGLLRQYYLRSSSELGEIAVNLQPKAQRQQSSHALAVQMRPALQAIAKRHGARLKVVEVPPGPPVQAPIVAEIYGPSAAVRQQIAQQVGQIFATTAGVVDIDSSDLPAAPRKVLLIDRSKAARLGVTQAEIVATLRAGLDGTAASWLIEPISHPAPIHLHLPPEQQGNLSALLALTVKNSSGQGVPLAELVNVSDGQRQTPVYHKDGLALDFVTGDMAGPQGDSPLYAMFAMRAKVGQIMVPGGKLEQLYFHAPQDASQSAVKWDGEWQVTWETFRDMGAAYAVGLVLIYLLVVAQFGSYLTPLIIMAPIPLTIIGVMPGHALFGAQYTATSMIGMIALAGIIVRNSILLVDYIQLQQAQGVALERAIVHATSTRAQPILLTALAAMLGACFILDDPIFNGLALSLIFGILVSSLLTLVVIPLLYYGAARRMTVSKT